MSAPSRMRTFVRKRWAGPTRPHARKSCGRCECGHSLSPSKRMENSRRIQWHSLIRQMAAGQSGSPQSQGGYRHGCVQGSLHPVAERRLPRRGEPPLSHRSAHRGDGRTATFKWSRENGSVVASWIETEGNNLVVDTARGFQANQWVELIDDSKELRALPGTLVKVSNVEAN